MREALKMHKQQCIPFLDDSSPLYSTIAKQSEPNKKQQNDLQEKTTEKNQTLKETLQQNKTLNIPTTSKLAQEKPTEKNPIHKRNESQNKALKNTTTFKPNHSYNLSSSNNTDQEMQYSTNNNSPPPDLFFSEPSSQLEPISSDNDI